ncbi:Fic family protein [Butyricimonas sp. BSD2780061689_150309_C8]
MGFQHRSNFKKRYINPLLGNRLQMTIPDKPTSRFQKYKSIR